VVLTSTQTCVGEGEKGRKAFVDREQQGVEGKGDATYVR